MTGRVLQPCGTVAAYLRHRRHGEPPCQACRDAKAQYNQERRDAETDRKAHNRMLLLAQRGAAGTGVTGAGNISPGSSHPTAQPVTGETCRSLVAFSEVARHCQLPDGHDGPHRATTNATYTAEMWCPQRGDTACTLTWEAPVAEDLALREVLLERRAEADAR